MYAIGSFPVEKGEDLGTRTRERAPSAGPRPEGEASATARPSIREEPSGRRPAPGA